jgi:hypothetical protein
MSSTSFRRGLGAGILTAAVGVGAFLTAGALLAGAQTPDAPTTTEPGTEAPDDATRPPRPTEEELEAARACMAEKGFELPERQLDENGRPVRPDPSQMPERTEEEREAFKAAAEECGLPKPRHHRGPGGPGGPGCDEPAGEHAPPAEENAPAEPEVEGSSLSLT